MRQHDWQLSSVDDPATMEVRTGYRCRACGSRLAATVKYHPSSPQIMAETMQRAREDVMRKLEADHPADCEEAARLNVCRQVHDS